MSPEELKQKIIESGHTFLPVHDCGMCKYKCGYIIQEDVEYDNGCYCVTYSGIRPSSWVEVFETYKMQSDKGKAHLLNSWGLNNVPKI